MVDGPPADDDSYDEWIQGSLQPEEGAAGEGGAAEPWRLAGYVQSEAALGGGALPLIGAELDLETTCQDPRSSKFAHGKGPKVGVRGTAPSTKRRNEAKKQAVVVENKTDNSAMLKVHHSLVVWYYQIGRLGLLLLQVASDVFRIICRRRMA